MIGVSEGPRPSPTVRRRYLGAELRRYRERAKLTGKQAGAAIGKAPSRISKIETGAQPITRDELDILLDLYDVPEDERPELHEAQAHAAERDLHVTYRSPKLVPKHFRRYAAIEQSASVIRTYHAELVPGLLQTLEYSQALFRCAVTVTFTPEEAARAAEYRQERQAILTGSSPVRLHSVIGEGVLRRLVGGPKVMAAQLRRIVEFAASDNVTVQVLPFSAGEHSAMDLPFALLQFPDLDKPSIVYVEQIHSATYLDDDGSGMQAYSDAFADLVDRSVGVDKSAQLMLEFAEQYEST